MMVVARSLDHRTAGDLQRLEQRAVRSEELNAWGQTRAHASRVHLAVIADRPDLAEQSAAAIVSIANRRLRQLGGDAA